jgi:hypothetical protein
MPTAQQPSRRWFSMAQDAARPGLLLFGGQLSSTNGMPGTWRYGGMAPATSRLLGPGCGGGNGVPMLTAGEPYLGCPDAAIQISAAPPARACLLALSFAAQTQPLGNGCWLHLQAPLDAHLLFTDATGFAELRIAVPLVAALRSVTLHAQAAVLDPQGPLNGMSLTAARTLVVGD